MFKEIAALMAGLLTVMPLPGLADPYTLAKLASIPQYAWHNGAVSENGRFALLGGASDAPDRMWSAEDGVAGLAGLFSEELIPTEINNSGQILGVRYYNTWDKTVGSTCLVELYTPGAGTATVIDFTFPIEPETFGQDCRAHLNDKGHVIVAITDRIDHSNPVFQAPVETRFFRYDGSSSAEFKRVGGHPYSWRINNRDKVAMAISGKIRTVSPGGRIESLPFPGVPKKYAEIQRFSDDGQLLVLSSGRAYRGPKRRRTFDIGTVYGTDGAPVLFTSGDRVVGTHLKEGLGYLAFTIGKDGKSRKLDCVVPNSSRLSFQHGVGVLPDGTIFADAYDLDGGPGSFVRLKPTNDGTSPDYCVQSVKLRYGDNCEGLNPYVTEGTPYPAAGTACSVEVTVTGPDGKPVGGADVRIVGDGNTYAARTNGAGKAVIGFTYQEFVDCYTVQAPFGHETLRTESQDFPNCRYPV